MKNKNLSETVLKQKIDIAENIVGILKKEHAHQKESHLKCLYIGSTDFENKLYRKGIQNLETDIKSAENYLGGLRKMYGLYKKGVPQRF